MNTTEEKVEGELVTVGGAYLVAIEGEDSLVAHSEEAALCVVDDSIGRVLVDAWRGSDPLSIVTVYFGSTVSSTQVRMKRSRLRRLGAEVLPLDLDRARAAAEGRRS
jgi:hypothetical protein